MLRAVPVLAAHEIALISMLEVLLGPLWAWWGAGERVATATLQGGLLVLCALVLNEVLGRWQRSRPTPH
jgi:drug/metabolite transporter (DMT)-like permease